MLRSRATVMALGVSLVLVACGGSKSDTTASGGTPTTTSSGVSSTATRDDGVKAAALSWARAYLTGTALDIDNMQGPDCLSGLKPSPSNEAAATAQLQQARRAFQRTTGMSDAAIEAKIAGVSVRNATATSAEAEVRYNLPESVTGNDNWVTYERVNGTWKVQDCRAPIGGSSSSSSVTIPAP